MDKDKEYGPVTEGDEYISEIREAILGWTIVEVGKTNVCKYVKGFGKGSSGMVEGGLTLILEDHRGKKRKVILGYTELGEWLEHKQDLKEKK